MQGLPEIFQATPAFHSEFLPGNIHYLFILDLGQMYIFDQMVIKMIFMFYMYNEGPIIAFMQNSKDFFIYF